MPYHAGRDVPKLQGAHRCAGHTATRATTVSSVRRVLAHVGGRTTVRCPSPPRAMHALVLPTLVRCRGRLGPRVAWHKRRCCATRARAKFAAHRSITLERPAATALPLPAPTGPRVPKPTALASLGWHGCLHRRPERESRRSWRDGRPPRSMRANHATHRRPLGFVHPSRPPKACI